MKVVKATQWDSWKDDFLAPSPRPVEQAGGGYEGASRLAGDLALWSPSQDSADGDILPQKEEADARVRDLHRNDAYVMSGVQHNQDAIVGSIFLLNSKPKFKVLGLDEVWAEEFQEEVESQFGLYTESLNCWIDASRHDRFTELVRLAVGSILLAGEVLGAVEWMDKEVRPFNTAIQMIDLDRLSNPDGVSDTLTLRRGVVRDRHGAPLGFHVRMAHPADNTYDAKTWTWKYVPIRKPWGRFQMIHLFDRARPDQSRGISDLTAALKVLRITQKFRDIVLQNAVVNATFAAAIESELPSEVVYQQLGGASPTAVTDYASSYLDSVAKYVGGSKNLALDGVRIPHLYPGTKLALHQAGTPGGVGTDFEKSLLRYLAADLGISYEELSKDYSGSSYIASRAAMNQTARRMGAKKKTGADSFANHVYRLWLEEALNTKKITSVRRSMPNWYDGLNAEAYSNCTWIGAGRGQTDELKETQAARLRIDARLSTHEIEVARIHGADYREVFAQSQREQKDMKARGLEMVTSPSIAKSKGDGRKVKKDEKAHA